ncbi:MAG TPA: SMP-30/gluconolactonase/LRE family protein [Anaeromyxobacter sp.]|nr:SMP-30/gluconolactonase/LRE family protein [Anaeromyxobacter sp.]
MKAFMKGLAVALVAFALAPAAARAWDRDRARPFATLPAGASGPEGIEVDASGRVYVGTSGFTATGFAPPPGQIFVYDDRGRLLRQLAVAGSSANLLGLRLHPTSGALLVVDFGAGQVLAVDPETGSSTPFLTLPPPAGRPHPELGVGLNDVTFDGARNVYVSDSFQGVVWRTGPQGGVATVWVDSPLLRTSGVPPFGANGLRFDQGETAMFVANTGDDRVIRIPVTASAAGPVAGTPSVFANSVNGADGLLVDADDNVWVAANQADEIVVLDRTGKAIAKLGDFGGAIVDGAPEGLLFPASSRFLGKDLLVTNLALDLRLFDPSFTSPDSAWCAQVTRYTVSRIPARIR